MNLSMTADEVMQNLISLGACEAGKVWAAEKDSVAMWASIDEMAAPYLFWWAIKNAGMIGWKSIPETFTALRAIADIGYRYNTIFVSELQHRLRSIVDNSNFVSSALDFYAATETAVLWESRHNADVLARFRREVIAVIHRDLRPNV
jgi:hypothetical protein